jgi:PIN domain nuclease of toxin-antitoxin system
MGRAILCAERPFDTLIPLAVQLPGEFHRDPVDQIIVATARFYDCPLLTSDGKILKYPHVKTVA